MSAFDVTIRTEGASIVAVEEGDKIYEAQLVLGVATLIPISPEQAVPLPLGLIRTTFDKPTVAGFIKEFQAIYDRMDNRPDIAIAQSLPNNLQ